MDSRILELQQELFRLTSFKSAQSLALQRLQMGGSLQEVLFEDDVPIDQAERQRIKSLVDQQRKLSTEILAHQRHCEELRREQEIVQEERRDVTQQSRVLMKQLKELQENENKAHKDSHKKLREDIERAEGHLSIARNVLQGLIVGSGVHWAEDPKLQELLLSLGEKVS